MMTEVIKEDLYEVHTCVWQEIEIELKYWPLKWTVISHLEIRSVSPEKAPLPITETGYKSHFFQPDKEWLDYVETSRQGDLFQ